MIEQERSISANQAKHIGDAIGIDWNNCEIDQFQLGLEIELEHGVRDPTKTVTHRDRLLAGKIAWAHLNDNANFYTRFERIG